MQPTLDLIGLVATAWPPPSAFYRRLGVPLPDTTAADAPHVGRPLAGGVRVEPRSGSVIRSGEPRLGLPQAVRMDDELAAVLYVDSFGNVKLAGTAADLFAVVGDDPGQLEVGMGERTLQLPWATTSPTSPSVTHSCSTTRTAASAACNQADASTVLGLAPDDPVVIRRAA